MLDMVSVWCHHGVMNLNPYVEQLRLQLRATADAGGDEARALVERLTVSLDSGIRLMLLEALSAAAGEITSELVPGGVEVRLRGGDPEFVVTRPASETFDEEVRRDAPTPTPSSGGDAEAEDRGAVRTTLRLPENLKQRADEAAAAEGVSVNTWLVQAVASALQPKRRRSPTGSFAGDRFNGWVR
ncbi:MAG: hypothetical protein JWP75_1331 [Frondihabitans sp.]|nr:hypothetical protein [Frondihabitans sp.]